ncbi:MAG: hypothetical protein OHK0019_38600 [Saprospiraceae bacterium]
MALKMRIYEPKIGGCAASDKNLQFYFRTVDADFKTADTRFGTFGYFYSPTNPIL